MTTVRTLAITRTQTATYVAQKIVGAMQLILTELGLGSASFRYDWRGPERAMAFWMDERTLISADVEVYDVSTDRMVTLFAFPISYYDSTATDATFRSDLEMARNAARKALPYVGAGIAFRFLIYARPNHTPLPGWTTTTARSTDGMTKYAVGEGARGPYGAAAIEFWIRRQ